MTQSRQVTLRREFLCWYRSIETGLTFKPFLSNQVQTYSKALVCPIKVRAGPIRVRKANHIPASIALFQDHLIGHFLLKGKPHFTTPSWDRHARIMDFLEYFKWFIVFGYLVLRPSFTKLYILISVYSLILSIWLENAKLFIKSILNKLYLPDSNQNKMYWKRLILR